MVTFHLKSLITLISFQFPAKANNVDSENEDYYFYDYGNDPGENSGNISSKN